MPTLLDRPVFFKWDVKLVNLYWHLQVRVFFF